MPKKDIILIIGNGRVAEGATELLEEFQVKQVCTKDFIGKNYNYPVYCQLAVRDYMKKPSGQDFEEQEYFINPENFNRLPDEARLTLRKRFNIEEELNGKSFAKELSKLGDIYINEAFSCSHRAHASVNAIT